MSEREEWAFVLLGVTAVAFVAFMSIPLALYLDYTNHTGKLTNFINMWQSFGVLSVISFFGTMILLSYKKRPEYFKSERRY
jgi:hypothetical protein